MRIAIIPARGGSKRIINKNIKSFLGTPIIGRVIETVKESGIFDRIIISTDSADVAEISRNFGAEVPFMRPSNLSDDFSGTSEVISHAIGILELEKDIDTQVCCVYPTSVLMNSGDILGALNLFQDQNWEYVFAASQPSSSPLRAFKKSPRDGVEMLFPEYWSKRSQDLPDCFVDAGFFYWATAPTWVTSKPIFGSYSSFVEIPEIRAVDINTEADWMRAECIFELMANGKIY